MKISDNLNTHLETIASKQIALAKLEYSSDEYDNTEDELHDLEDDLMDKFGDLLDEVLAKVHKKVCPESEPLMPIAYLAQKFQVNENSNYTVPLTEGVIVECKSPRETETRLVLVPGPPRILLHVGTNEAIEVWNFSS